MQKGEMKEEEAEEKMMHLQSTLQKLTKQNNNYINDGNWCSNIN